MFCPHWIRNLILIVTTTKYERRPMEWCSKLLNKQEYGLYFIYFYATPPLLWLVFHTLNGVHIKIVSVGLTPNGGTTVHVLWSVLEQTMAAVVVLNMVERHSLETSPAQWQDDGVPSLQYTTVPAVFLQSHLYNHTNKRSKNTLLSISLSMHIYKYIQICTYMYI